MESRKLVIVGAGETAEMAGHYFSKDTEYEVISYCVERDFIASETFCGKPVVALEDLDGRYSATEVDVFVAASFTKLNRVRERLIERVESLGYKLASYVSPHAYVEDNAVIGPNCFVLEDNTIQYGVSIGKGSVLWSGNHVGHRTEIAENVFVSSHVVISGFCKIGQRSFLGVNSSLNDGIRIEEDVVVGSGAVVTKHCQTQGVYVGSPAKRLEKRTSLRAFGVDE